MFALNFIKQALEGMIKGLRMWEKIRLKVMRDMMYRSALGWGKMVSPFNSNVKIRHGNNQ